MFILVPKLSPFMKRRIYPIRLLSLSDRCKLGELKPPELKDLERKMDAEEINSFTTKEKLITECETLLNLRSSAIDYSIPLADINPSAPVISPVSTKCNESVTVEKAVPSYQSHRFPVGSLRNSRIYERSGDMELTFLGTASCIPSVTRGVSSIALHRNGDVWLTDCGESTQFQIQKSRVKISRINKIFITHAHGDHSFGIPGVLCMIGQGRSYQNQRTENFGDGDEVLDIYGPEGIRELVRAVIQLTFSKIVAPHRIHELKTVPFLHQRYARRPLQPKVYVEKAKEYGEVEGGTDIYPDEYGQYTLVDDEEILVSAAPLQHTVPCVGYVFNEKPRMGTLLVEKVMPYVNRNKAALHKIFRGHMRVMSKIKSLQPGQTYQFPDGSVLSGDDVKSPARNGRKVVILGDTCSSDHIASLAANADVLVHEATNAWTRYVHDKFPSYQRFEQDTIAHGHSTPQMAGRFAKKTGAKMLVLTHFSSRYLGDDSYSSMANMWDIEDMAASECSKERGGRIDRKDILAAWDNMVLPVVDNSKKSDNYAASLTPQQLPVDSQLQMDPSPPRSTINKLPVSRRSSASSSIPPASATAAKMSAAELDLNKSPK